MTAQPAAAPVAALNSVLVWQLIPEAPSKGGMAETTPGETEWDRGYGGHALIRISHWPVGSSMARRKSH